MIRQPRLFRVVNEARRRREARRRGAGKLVILVNVPLTLSSDLKPGTGLTCHGDPSPMSYCRHRICPAILLNQDSEVRYIASS